MAILMLRRACCRPTTGMSPTGPCFEDYGAWKRPEYYVPPMAAIVKPPSVEEVLALRVRAPGFFDASPLGKIELKGPDAGEFLNRIFVNNALTLKPGRIRYGLDAQRERYRDGRRRVCQAG